MREGRLAGKVALITGSTHGIGKETAGVLATHGASVVVTGRNDGAGDAVTAALEQGGAEAIFAHADLTIAADVERLVDRAIDRFGHIDILVNNAAGTTLNRNGVDCAISESTDEGWEEVIAVNLMGVVRVTRLVLRSMLERDSGGAIVNVSSTAASRGGAGFDAYTATKGAVTALTRSIAVEYGERGIRCNTVQLGAVRIDDERGHTSIADVKNRFLRVTRPGRPADVANAILFLVSDESEFVTGVVLPVDGGLDCILPLPWMSPRPEFAKR